MDARRRASDCAQQSATKDRAKGSRSQSSTAPRCLSPSCAAHGNDQVQALRSADRSERRGEHGARGAGRIPRGCDRNYFRAGASTWSAGALPKKCIAFRRHRPPKMSNEATDNLARAFPVYPEFRTALHRLHSRLRSGGGCSHARDGSFVIDYRQQSEELDRHRRRAAEITRSDLARRSDRRGPTTTSRSLLPYLGPIGSPKVGAEGIQYLNLLPRGSHVQGTQTHPACGQHQSCDCRQSTPTYLLG